MTNSPTLTFFFEVRKNMSDSKTNEKAGELVIAIGQTGCGKSSLIKIFCGDAVKVSSGKESETKDSKIFESQSGSRFFIDTQGTNDTNGESAEFTLSKIMKFIHDEHLSFKILWFISQSSNRALPQWQTEAKFISSLGEYSKIDVWKCVFCILKGGHLKQELPQGTFEAAKEYGAQKIPCIGYQCTDWLSKDDAQYTLLKGKLDSETLEGLGYVSEQRIMQLVDERLSAISKVAPSFKDDTCLKCGCCTDQRISMLYNCHSIIVNIHGGNEKWHPGETVCYHKLSATEKRHEESLIYFHLKEYMDYHPMPLEKVHGEPLECYHPGKYEKKFHPHPTENFHDGGVKWYHPDKFPQKFHRNPKKIHNGSLTHSGSKEHLRDYDPRTGDRVVSGIFSLGLSEIGATGYYPCCNRRGSDANGCSWSCCNNSIDSNGCKYSCCDRSSGSSGCVPSCCETDDSGCASKYPCCGFESNGGCRSKMICCEKDTNSRGCKTQYICCKNGANHVGCQLQWQCCLATRYEAEKCKTKYPCCQQSPHSTGCKDQYICCQQSKGTNGCQKQWECCEKKSENANGCESKYLCCNQKMGTQGCTEIQKCCGQKLGSKGCTQKWACCSNENDLEKKISNTACTIRCKKCLQETSKNTKGCIEICAKCGKNRGEEGCEQTEHAWSK